jgi:hypothetical protein
MDEEECSTFGQLAKACVKKLKFKVPVNASKDELKGHLQTCLDGMNDLRLFIKDTCGHMFPIEAIMILSEHKFVDTVVTVIDACISHQEQSGSPDDTSRT